MKIQAIIGFVAHMKDVTYTDRLSNNRVNSKVTNLKAYIHGCPANKKYDSVFFDFGLWAEKAEMGQNLKPADVITVECDQFKTEKVELENELTGEITHALKVKPARACKIEVLDGDKYVALSEYKATAKTETKAKAEAPAGMVAVAAHTRRAPKRK